jgi:hypothetical protein
MRKLRVGPLPRTIRCDLACALSCLCIAICFYRDTGSRVLSRVCVCVCVCVFVCVSHFMSRCNTLGLTLLAFAVFIFQISVLNFIFQISVLLGPTGSKVTLEFRDGASAKEYKVWFCFLYNFFSRFDSVFSGDMCKERARDRSVYKGVYARVFPSIVGLLYLSILGLF